MSETSNSGYKFPYEYDPVVLLTAGGWRDVHYSEDGPLIGIPPNMSRNVVVDPACPHRDPGIVCAIKDLLHGRGYDINIYHSGHTDKVTCTLSSRWDTLNDVRTTVDAEAEVSPVHREGLALALAFYKLESSPINGYTVAQLIDLLKQMPQGHIVEIYDGMEDRLYRGEFEIQKVELRKIASGRRFNVVSIAIGGCETFEGVREEVVSSKHASSEVSDARRGY